MSVIGLDQFARNVRVLVAASPLFRTFSEVESADDIWADIQAAIAEEVIDDDELDLLFDQLKIFESIAADDVEASLPPRAIVSYCDYTHQGDVLKSDTTDGWAVLESFISVRLQRFRSTAWNRSTNLSRFGRQVRAIHDQMLHLPLAVPQTPGLVRLNRSMVVIPPWNVETDEGLSDILEYEFVVSPFGGTA